MTTTIEPESAATQAFKKHIQAQFEKANTTVGEKLAAQVLQAHEQGKLPAHELYGLVNLIRRIGNTDNSICNQLMELYAAAFDASGNLLPTTKK